LELQVPFDEELQLFHELLVEGVCPEGFVMAGVSLEGREIGILFEFRAGVEE